MQAHAMQPPSAIEYVKSKKAPVERLDAFLNEVQKALIITKQLLQAIMFVIAISVIPSK